MTKQEMIQEIATLKASIGKAKEEKALRKEIARVKRNIAEKKRRATKKAS